MEPRYQFLRSCIYKTNVERKRFRQVLVNSVMCTDLHDDEINRWRLDRWNTAFKDYGETEPTRELFDRKATVVIENLIQMADIAHTMQHWPTYRRWNDRLFEEAANAHRIGRGSINPAATWYQEEVSFFDRIAIPLAQRIKAAGIFGPGGAQVYVSHVEENRNEWQLTGKSQLAELLKEKG